MLDYYRRGRLTSFECFDIHLLMIMSALSTSCATMGSTSSKSSTTSTSTSVVTLLTNNVERRSEETANNVNVFITTAAKVDRSGFLLYPRYFFGESDGANPKNEVHAMTLWPYRKNRPPIGAIDTEPPNGTLMLKEVKIIRQSLREFIVNACLDDLRRNAKTYNFVITKNNQPAIMEADFKAVLAVLENTAENQILVWNVFYKTFRDRHWLTSHVDAWFDDNRMILMDLPAAEKKDKKFYATVARASRTDYIKGYMSRMFSKTGWCLASKNSVMSPKKEYAKVIVGGDEYYVCTPKAAVNISTTLKVGQTFVFIVQPKHHTNPPFIQTEGSSG
jgi:hypothetical protein